jgi:hypothetical protein
MCRMGAYEGIQRGPRIEGDDIEDAVLPALEKR